MAQQSGDGADRRRALKTLVMAGGAAFSCGALVPTGRFFLAPVFASAHGDEKWTRVARLSDLSDKEPRRAAVVADRVDAWTRAPNEHLGAVWLIRDKEEVRAFSVVCPDLGCGIEYEAEAQKFLCPCHNSEFDAEGGYLRGPSPRGMDPIASRVVGEGDERFVEVVFKKFRTGIPGREEIG